VQSYTNWTKEESELPTTECNEYSGVTRVKGQPGQLTNKQLSRWSAERSWVGGGTAHRNPS